MPVPSPHPDAPPSFRVRPSLDVQPRPWRPIPGWVAGLAAIALLTLGWSLGSGVRDALDAYDERLDRVGLAFEAVPLLSDREVGQLRRSRNSVHVDTAERLGIEPIATRAGLDSARVASDSLVAVPSTDRYEVWDGEHSDPLLTPDGVASLDSIAARFGASLDALGLPRYRFTVSSVLRSAEDQAELRGVNSNAASGRSSHEYGTTYDITYRRYSPRPLDTPAAVPSSVPRVLRGAVRMTLTQRRDAAYARFAEAYPSRLDAILGRALIALEDEGVLVTVRERRQPVYHTTVAAPLAGRDTTST